MTEYISFHELMKVVKDGDLVKNESSNRTALEFVDGVLRHRGGAQSKYDYPWDFKYKIIKPKPEMVTLTRPKFYQDPGAPRPYSNCGWYESKEEWIEKHSGWLTFGGWEEITVPKNSEDWNDGDS